MFGPSKPYTRVILHDSWLDFSERDVQRAIRNDRRSGRVPRRLRKYFGLTPSFRATIATDAADTALGRDLQSGSGLSPIGRRHSHRRLHPVAFTVPA